MRQCYIDKLKSNKCGKDKAKMNESPTLTGPVRTFRPRAGVRYTIQHVRVKG